jgi:hypothetical protein
MNRYRASLLVASLGLLSACGWIDKAASEDTKLIIFSPGQPSKVAVDGGAAMEISANTFSQIPVGPGKHSVVINGDRTLEINLAAFDRWVVPVMNDQCFMSLDVSLSHYGENSKAAPVITARKQASEPFKLPAGNYLREDDLPRSRKQSDRALLYRSASCAEIDALESGVAAKPADAADAADAKPEAAGDLFAALATAANCPDAAPTERIWCPAVAGWASAKLAPLPAKGQTFIGLSLELHEGRNQAAAILNPRISVLALAPEGEAGKASLTTLKGDNPQEQSEIDAVVAGLGRMFASDGPAVEVPAGLNGYLDSMPGAAATALKADGNGWILGDGKAQLRRIGEHWVTVEPLPAGSKGMFFSVHTDKRRPAG